MNPFGAGYMRTEPEAYPYQFRTGSISSERTDSSLDAHSVKEDMVKFKDLVEGEQWRFSSEEGSRN